MILFREKYIRHQMETKWTDKWTNFLRSKEESLNFWYFDEKLFIEKYNELYDNFNKNAHPLFNIRGFIEIPYLNCLTQLNKSIRSYVGKFSVAFSLIISSFNYIFPKTTN